jgi:hypothetical protein
MTQFVAKNCWFNRSVLNCIDFCSSHAPYVNRLFQDLTPHRTPKRGPACTVERAAAARERKECIRLIDYGQFTPAVAYILSLHSLTRARLPVTKSVQVQKNIR